MSKTARTATAVIIGLGLVGLLVLLTASSDDQGGMSGRDIDGAFITAMVPHHEEAVEMAEIARERTRRADVRRLASGIVAAQGREIEDLTFAHQRIFGQPLPTTGMAHGDLGLSEEQMGMSMDMRELEQAREFDRTFIDMMIRHHQGAIRMARVELRRGQDPELKSAARDVIAAQSREIEKLNSWRRSWYGAASPSGGVPS